MSDSFLSRVRNRWMGRQVLALRVTVTLTAAVALLSVVTGIANVSTQSLVGPFADFIPPGIQRTAGFTGTLTGFLMIGSAYGLRRHLRLAWYSTVVLLPVTALQGLLQSSPLSLPLIVLSVLAMPNVIINRKHFDRSLSLTTSQLGAAAAIIGAQIYGTVGAYALREEFLSINTLVDAFYYTLVTASTVGYGDATPTSQAARLFGMSVVVVGTASFAVALGTLLGPVIQARFAKVLGRMNENELDLLENHILILGYSDLTSVVIDTLRDREDILVVSSDREQMAELGEQGLNVLTANTGDDESLETAGIDRARAVIVGTNDDAADALTILTVRQVNRDVQVYAIATNRENINKLEQAGADVVISPAVITAEQLVRATMGDEAEQYMELLRDADEGRVD